MPDSLLCWLASLVAVTTQVTQMLIFRACCRAPQGDLSSDVRWEAAHNLALIYKSSGAPQLARQVLKCLCLVWIWSHVGQHSSRVAQDSGVVLRSSQQTRV